MSARLRDDLVERRRSRVAASPRSAGRAARSTAARSYGGEAAPGERALVHRDRAAVQLDGALAAPPRRDRAAGRAAARSRPGTDWCRSRRRAAPSRARSASRKWQPSSPAAARIVCSIASGERSRSGSRRELGRRRDVACSRPPWCGPCPSASSASAPDVTTMSQPSTRSHAAGGDARRVEIIGAPRDAHVARDRAVLLREAGHVEHRRALALRGARPCRAARPPSRRRCRRCP